MSPPPSGNPSSTSLELLLGPLRAARTVLGFDPSDLKIEAGALKRAYRREVIAHAPDVDPDGFRRVREAFEVLENPPDPIEAIVAPVTKLLPPPVPLPAATEPAPAHALAVALLRKVVGGLDTSDLMAASTSP